MIIVNINLLKTNIGSETDAAQIETDGEVLLKRLTGDFAWAPPHRLRTPDD